MYKIPKARLIVLKIIISVIVFFALISSLIAGFFVFYIRTPVNGTSMVPTLNIEYEATSQKDIIYVNRFNKGRIGDIVVLDLRQHIEFEDYTVKRLVAEEGDIVNIIFDNQSLTYNLVVNGEIVESKPNKQFGYNTYSCFQQYVSYHQDSDRVIKNDQNKIEGIIIKSGEIFVLGDNWDVSKDSSTVGPISKSAIVGRVDIIVKPTQNEILTVLKRIF